MSHLYFFALLASIGIIGSATASSAPFHNLQNEIGSGTGHQRGQRGRSDTSETDPDIYRLSDEVIPKSYELRIFPDLEKFTFVGKVEINIHVKFSTKQITLHSKKLTIKSVRVLGTDSSKTPVDNTRGLDEANDLLIIETTRSLIFNTDYTVIIEFEGVIGDELEGLYRSSYTVDNKESWMAITQFEPTHARQAFPCFDEPRFKTPFTIYLARFQNQLAVTNMPSESILPSDTIIGSNRLWEKFATSPPIPTYLVSFMVADFTYATNNENSIRVITKKNSVQRGMYALKQSTQILNQLQGYFGVSSKLAKMDVVAVPDFEQGGMENWGMVTFKERFVLTDEGTSSAQHKHIITQLISHEFAHQWFGNLATPAWYSYLWLKEGFATYFETFAAAAVQPDWDLDQLYVIEYVQESLWNEVTTQRPMTANIWKSYEIMDLFDTISYGKAGSIIRMFEHMVSPSTFKLALHRFLTDAGKFHDGTVVEKNLFDAFHTETQRFSYTFPSRIEISDIMRTWTENPGYPVIKVTRNYSNGKVEITQSPYQAQAAPAPLKGQKWIVPLTYTTKSQLQFSNTRPTSWSFADQATELQQTISNTDWIIFNLQHAGYYRVNYDTNNWNFLVDQMQQDHQKIHVLNRAQLINDAYVLAFDKHLSYKIPLKMTEYLTKETDMIPWYAAIKVFNVLRLKLQSTTNDAFFKTYLYNLVKKQYDTQGFEIKSADSHLTKIIKPLFLMLACDLGIEDCIQKSLEEYKKNEADLTKVQPDLKRVVYCHALLNSQDQKTVYNNLWNTYLKHDISFEKQQILSALSCASDEDVIKNILSKMFDSKNKEIRKQDISFFISPLTQRPKGITALIKFIADNVATIPQLSDDRIELLEAALDAIEYHVRTQEQVQQLKELETKFNSLDQNKYGEFVSITKRIMSTSEDTIKYNVQKLDRLHKDYLQSDNTVQNKDEKNKAGEDKKPETPTKDSTTEKPASGATVPIPKLGWNLFFAGFVLFYSLSKISLL